MVAKFLKSIVVLGCFLMFLDCFHNSSFDQWWGPPNGRGINSKPWPFVFRRFDVLLNLGKNIFYKICTTIRVLKAEFWKSFYKKSTFCKGSFLKSVTKKMKKRESIETRTNVKFIPR